MHDVLAGEAVLVTWSDMASDDSLDEPEAGHGDSLHSTGAGLFHAATILPAMVRERRSFSTAATE
jgi:hypothetical protein